MAEDLRNEISATCRTRLYPRETHLKVLDVIIALERRVDALESSLAAAHEDNEGLMEVMSQMRVFLERQSAEDPTNVPSAAGSASTDDKASGPPDPASCSQSGVGDEHSMGDVVVHEPEAVLTDDVAKGDGELVGVYRVEEVEELIEVANAELADRFQSLSRKNAAALREFLRAPRTAGGIPPEARPGASLKSGPPKPKVVAP